MFGPLVTHDLGSGPDSFFLFLAYPNPPRGGGGCLPAFFKMVGASDGTLAPGGWGWAKSGLVALRGRAFFPAPKAAEHFFPHIFFCVGQSVSAWVRLELSPPPPRGGRPKVGAFTSHSAPPRPVAN